MAFDAFSDKNVKQTTNQQQVGLDIGSGSSAFVLGGGSRLVQAGKGSTIGAITIYDPQAALKAIDANQALSNQAISWANINANNAFQTVQALASQLPALTAGATAQQLLTEPTAETVVAPGWIATHKTQVAVAVISGLLVVGIVVSIKKLKK